VTTAWDQVLPELRPDVLRAHPDDRSPRPGWRRWRRSPPRPRRVIRPATPSRTLPASGPLVSDVQRERVRGYIEKGLEEGAKLVTGGAEPPEGLEKGYFVRPTVFLRRPPRHDDRPGGDFRPRALDPPYDTEEEAISIANDSVYGLAGGVWAADNDKAKAVARRIRTAGRHQWRQLQPVRPFGGFKQSGHGRELGKFGLEEYLEIKSLQL